MHQIFACRFSELSLTGVRLNKIMVNGLCQLARSSSLSGLFLGQTYIGTVSELSLHILPSLRLLFTFNNQADLPIYLNLHIACIAGWCHKVNRGIIQSFSRVGEFRSIILWVDI